METLRAKEGPGRPRASIRSVRAMKKRLVLEKQNGEGRAQQAAGRDCSKNVGAGPCVLRRGE